MSYIGSELRNLRKENVRLNRKLALQRISGKVVERDPEKRKVRLEIGEDPQTGDKIKGPWVRVQSTSAGAFKGFVLPSIGEQMYVESPSGVIGADSLATFGAFDDETKHPQQGADEQVFENGQTRFSMKNGEIRAAVGEEGFVLTSGGLQMLGKFKGKGGTRPAHYVGGKDTDNDIAVDGNENVLI